MEVHEKDKDEMMEKDEKKGDGGDLSGSGLAAVEAMDTTAAEEAPVSEEAPKQGSLEWLLHQLLRKYVPMTKPSVRQVA